MEKQFLVEFDHKARWKEFKIYTLAIQHEVSPCIANTIFSDRYIFEFLYSPTDITINKRTFHYPANTLVVWSAGTDAKYGNRRHFWTKSFITCKGQFVKKILKTANIPCNKPFTFSETALIDWHLKAIYTQISSNRKLDKKNVQNDFINLIREIAYLIETKKHRKREVPSRIPTWCVRLQEFLENSYHLKHSIEDLADATNLSVRHFTREFKYYFGCSAIEYIAILRMQRAKALLLNPNLNISQIAISVGFNNVYYFSRMFKKYFALTPTQMRKKLLNA